MRYSDGMTKLPIIALNAGWTCEYMHPDATGTDPVGDEPVPSLVEWVFDRRRMENWVAWLRCGFDLYPTDACVSYLLRADTAPEEAQVFVNGERVGTISQTPYRLDVTNYVALEYNELAFRVEWNAAGRFEGLRLEAVPCA